MNDLLAQLFSSRVRAAVLGHMLTRPHMRFSLTELSRALDLPVSSLQHECYKLERIGILMGRREGNSRRYRLDSACAVLPQLSSLVVAALGQEASLRATLQDVAGLEAAFLAKTLPYYEGGEGTTASSGPIPLVLIGEVGLEEIESAQERVASLLGLAPNRVEAVFYSPTDWASRIEQGSQYAVWLINNARTDLVGDPTVAAA